MRRPLHFTFPLVGYANNSAGADGGTRTRTPIRHKILSLGCLPVPTHPHDWRLGVYHDTAEAERVMLHKALEGLGYFYRLGFSQPYILSITQTIEFVNTFLKKIFIFFGAGGFHFPTEQ